MGNSSSSKKEIKTDIKIANNNPRVMMAKTPPCKIYKECTCPAESSSETESEKVYFTTNIDNSLCSTESSHNTITVSYNSYDTPSSSFSSSDNDEPRPISYSSSNDIINSSFSDNDEPKHISYSSNDTTSSSDNDEPNPISYSSTDSSDEQTHIYIYYHL